MTDAYAKQSRSSMDRVNYSLRPAKSVERKMMCEALRGLGALSPLSDYCYVGFGSAFFTDFSLFHRALGITDLVSIEGCSAREDRVRFNAPYDCVQIEIGHSNEVLVDPEKVPWAKPTIAWLDYDYPLDHTVLADVDTFCEKARAGSVLVVTVAAPDLAPWRKDASKEKRSNRARRERFGQKLGQALGGPLPVTVSDADLKEWGTARVYHRIISDRLGKALEEARGATPDRSAICYQQLFNFHYADSTHMLTVGGLIYDPDIDGGNVAKCGFERLPFVCDGEHPYHIHVPPLTFREMRWLDQHLPADTPPDASFLERGAVEAYSSIYRYFPAFAETEI